MGNPLSYLGNKALFATLGGVAGSVLKETNKRKGLYEAERLSRQLSRKSIIDKYFHPEEIAVLQEKIRQAAERVNSNDFGVKKGIFFGKKLHKVVRSANSPKKMSGNIGSLLMNVYDHYTPIDNRNIINRLKIVRERENALPFYALKNKERIGSLDRQIANLEPLTKMRGRFNRGVRSIGANFAGRKAYKQGYSVYKNVFNKNSRGGI